jgi:hypothetical protein
MRVGPGVALQSYTFDRHDACKYVQRRVVPSQVPGS